MLTQMLDEASAAMTTRLNSMEANRKMVVDYGRTATATHTKTDVQLKMMMAIKDGKTVRGISIQDVRMSMLWLHAVFVCSSMHPTSQPSVQPSIHPRQPHIQTKCKCKKLTMQRFVVVRLCLLFVSESHIHMCMSSIYECMHARKKKTLYKNSKYIVY